MSIDKRGYRTLPTINRNSDNIENQSIYPKWMQDFASNLEKGAVQSRKQDSSIYDQISSIINGNKPKYSSVEDAIRDMQERSGLLAYQNRIKAMATKIAGTTEEVQAPTDTNKAEIKVFKLNPQVQQTIDNYIDDTNGDLPIPAIVEKIKAIHRNDITDDAAWNEDELMKYINKQCVEAKKKHPSIDDSNANLGKLPHFDDKDIDPSNMDALFSLNPVAIK
jgi:hypothetical protein